MTDTTTVLRATVTNDPANTGLSQGQGAYVLIDGSTTQVTANGLGNYAPQPGDRVLCTVVGSQVEILQFISPTSLLLDGTVTGAKLAAQIVLASQILVGSNISIDPTNGIVITLANGGLISLPTNGVDNAKFLGVVLEAQSLLVDDNFELRGGSGGTNKIAGTLQLAKGVSTPTVGPVVGTTWSGTLPSHLSTNGPTNSAGGVGLIDDGTNWVTATGGSAVVGYNKSTGIKTAALGTTATDFAGCTVLGVTKLGSNFYVLAKVPSAFGTNYSVFQYDTSWNLLGYGAAFNAPSGGGADGPNSIAADANTGLLYLSYNGGPGSTGRVTVKSITTTGGSPTTLFQTATTDVYSTTNPYLWVGNADFGSQRILIGAGVASPKFTGYTSGGTISPSASWTGANFETQRGVWYDGTNFWTLTAGSSVMSVWKMSPIVSNTQYDVRYSQYDSNATGGTHETAWSPATVFTQPARWWMLVTTPGPQSGGTDQPNSIRHYIGPHSGTIWRQADITAAPWNATYGAPLASGSSAVSTPDFSGVIVAGVIASGTLLPDGVTPQIQLLGDGTGGIGFSRFNSNGLPTKIGYVDFANLTSTINVTSTTNVTLTGMSITFTADGPTNAPNETYWIDIDASVSLAASTAVNSIELLIDGIAISPTMDTGMTTAGQKIPIHKRWVIVGLSAGSHTATARSRNGAASTNVNVNSPGTSMFLQRVK